MYISMTVADVQMDILAVVTGHREFSFQMAFEVMKEPTAFNISEETLLKKSPFLCF